MITAGRAHARIRTSIAHRILLCTAMLGCTACGPGTPKPGHYKGDGISFSVEQDGKSVTGLQVVKRLYGGQASVEWAREPLAIEGGCFRFWRRIGMSQTEVKGCFSSRTAASGTVNDSQQWTARWTDPERSQ